MVRRVTAGGFALAKNWGQFEKFSAAWLRDAQAKKIAVIADLEIRGIE